MRKDANCLYFECLYMRAMTRLVVLYANSNTCWQSSRHLRRGDRHAPECPCGREAADGGKDGDDESFGALLDDEEQPERDGPRQDRYDDRRLQRRPPPRHARVDEHAGA